MTQSQINNAAAQILRADFHLVQQAAAMCQQRPVRPEPKNNMDKYLMGRKVA